MGGVSREEGENFCIIAEASSIERYSVEIDDDFLAMFVVLLE